MNLLIIQARMGSTRLPGKVMKLLSEKPLLGFQVDRVAKSRLVNQLVVATTENPEDNIIENFCQQNNIQCFRGSDWDVLDRFYQVACKYNPKTVIRVTADCPLHHAEVIDFAISRFNELDVDYFSNSNHEPDFLEDGIDVEVFSYESLVAAWNDAKLLSEREHVTPFIKNSGNFTCHWQKFNAQYSFKLSVDTQEDFEMVQEIISQSGNNAQITIPQICQLITACPEILEINKSSIINSGYKKSLENDRKI